ncbi:MAG: DUF2179 domain-containing protein [Candidatus Micrarchaeia archaeon]|jgi:uncharacterized protein YebE (UPF0316 family)
MEFTSSFIILPLLIFFARVIDVSLGTVRIIFISKGFKILSLIIGFVEVLIWLVAINQLWSNLSNVGLYIAYAAGFATGNYVGIWLEEKISIGSAMIRIIVTKDATKLVNELRKNNYSATIMDGKSGSEKTDVKVIFSVVRRKELKNIFKIIHKVNPKAFYTIEDIRSVRKDNSLFVNKKKVNDKKVK